MPAIDRPARRSARLIPLVALAACGSSHDAPASHRRVVPLADLPVATYVGGLPLSGGGTLTYDLSDDPDRITDWSKATGSIVLACDGCTLGDDHATLPLGGRGGFGGELHVSHLTWDTFRGRAELAAGRAHVTGAARGDLDLDLTADVTLHARGGESQVVGCLAFRAADRLRARDQKLYNTFALVGGARGDDGRLYLSIGGTLAAPRIFPAVCKT